MKTVWLISGPGALFVFIVAMIVLFGCKRNEEIFPVPEPTSDWVCLGGDSSALNANAFCAASVHNKINPCCPVSQVQSAKRKMRRVQCEAIGVSNTC